MKTILIVDDNVFVGRGLIMLLNALNYDCEIIEAATEAQAIELSKSLLPTIILIDCCLPGKNGFVVVRKVVEVSPQSKIILLSIHDDPDNRAQAKCQGISVFVSKHENPIELLRVIRHYLENAR